MTKKKRVARFYYVRSSSGWVRHRVYSMNANVIEGDKTACGLVVALSWKLAGSDKHSALSRCKRCVEAPGAQISVERVRGR